LAVTGEMTGRQCWEVHKDAVTGIIEKHIKDPALVKRLADAWDSAVDLGVTTAKASPAQKKKKTDRAIRLTSIRQATSVLLSQIGLIACKWCVYRGLHDCCLTTKKQFGQLGDSELCCGGVACSGHGVGSTWSSLSPEWAGALGVACVVTGGHPCAPVPSKGRAAAIYASVHAYTRRWALGRVGAGAWSGRRAPPPRLPVPAGSRFFAASAEAARP